MLRVLYARRMAPGDYLDLGAPTPLSVATYLTAYYLEAVLKVNLINL